MPNPINIFIIYAREDKEIKRRLLAHLTPFVRSYNLVIWHDENLEAGQEWKPHIESRLEQTDLFLLLVSVDFMNSEFINQVEFKFAIDRHRTNKSIVIPIIINYCQWDIDFNFSDYNFNLNELQVLPEQGKPIDDWKTSEQAYNNIAAGIRKVVDKIKTRKLAEERQKNELELTRNKTEEKSIMPPDLPISKYSEVAAGEKAYDTPVESRIQNNETLLEENINEEKQQPDNIFIDDPRTEIEIEDAPGFWKNFRSALAKKKYLVGTLILLLLLYFVYLSIGKNNSHAKKEAVSDSLVTIVPIEPAPIITTDSAVKTEPIIKKEQSTKKQLPVDKDELSAKVETEASFPGGDNSWKSYLEKNLNADIAIQNGAPGGSYRVVVQFMVSKDGSIADVKALTMHGYGMEEEVISLIRKGPKWIPAVQNGQPVNANRRQPVTFLVEKK